MVKVFKETPRFDVATAAIKGGRDYQEDSLIAHFPLGQETGFTVLADGMGGHLSGDVASALVMTETFSRLKMKEMILDKGITDIPALLGKAASAANDCVTQYIEDEPESYGMGSTLLATVIRGEDMFWASVGDSPLYLFRDGEIRQLNQDHSMAPQIDMMVKVGAMDEEVGRNHPDRNTLTSAIAGLNINKIDCPSEATKVLPGDIIIVASDGIQFLSNAEIQNILDANRDKSSHEISQALLAAIAELDDPEQDNTAFTVIKLGDLSLQTAQTAADKGAALVQLKKDLRPVTRVIEVTADSVAEKPAVVTTPQTDEPTRRVIRLVRSQSRSFETPDETQTNPTSADDAKPQNQGVWYSRRRSLND